VNLCKSIKPNIIGAYGFLLDPVVVLVVTCKCVCGVDCGGGVGVTQFRVHRYH